MDRRGCGDIDVMKRPRTFHLVMRIGDGPESCRKNRAGVTLVEMSIACFILALLLAGFVTGFTFSRKAARAASDSMTAVHASRQGIEILVDTPYSSLTQGSYSMSSLGLSNVYTVTQNGTFPDVKDVTMTVYWTNPARKTQMSMSYSTSISGCLH